jgi:holo-[acyl-carrier protein] synthase
MIFGIGLDLIDIPEFTRTLERSGERFVQRIYTQREIEYCRSQPHPAQSFAVRFAAKEAAMKALGVAGQDGFSWRDFETVCNSSGKPTLALHRKAAATSASLHLMPLHISLSHSLSSAGAVAIAEITSTVSPRRRSTGLKRRSTRRAT